MQMGGEDQDAVAINREFWKDADLVGAYANRELRAVERVLLERYRSGLGGEVLELGCGAGGLTGPLCELARHVHGIDISPAMVEHCRRAYPQAEFTTADLEDLSWVSDGSYDAVVAPVDVLGASQRARLLDELRRILSPRGLLVFSSHNRDFSLGRLHDALKLWVDDPHRPLLSLRRLPLRLANRRRLRRLERTDGDTALRNDEAHDFALLHYNISRDAQARELSAHGYELLECLDLDGHTVEPGEQARRFPELHYVARRSD